jgi:hypothetical protein
MAVAIGACLLRSLDHCQTASFRRGLAACRDSILPYRYLLYLCQKVWGYGRGKPSALPHVL